MKAVGRWMVRGVKGLLLVVCMAALVAWPLRHLRAFQYGWAREEEELVRHQAMSCGCLSGAAWLEWSEVVAQKSRYSRHSLRFFDIPWVDFPGWAEVSEDEYAPWERRTGIGLRRTWTGRGGFGYYGEREDFGNVRWRRDVVVAPLWAIALTSGTWPVGSAVVGLLRWRRREQWQKAGCCTTCGYDLRGTPGRCPECGIG